MNDGYDGIDALPSEDAASAASRVTETTAPRRMKQPVKDELRRQLEVAKAELALAQLTYAKRLTLYMGTMGLLGVIVGAVLAWGLK